jgi:hypothetical protein
VFILLDSVPTLLFSSIGSLYGVQAGPELMIFLPLPLECWDYRHMLPHPTGYHFYHGGHGTCVWHQALLVHDFVSLSVLHFPVLGRVMGSRGCSQFLSTVQEERRGLGSSPVIRGLGGEGVSPSRCTSIFWELILL